MSVNDVIHASCSSSMKTPDIMAKGGMRSIRSVSISKRDSISPLQNTNKSMWSPSSDCSSDEDNSPTALNSFNWDKPCLVDKSVDFCCSPENQRHISAQSGPSYAFSEAESVYRKNGHLLSAYVDLKQCSDECDEDNTRKAVDYDSEIHLGTKTVERLQMCGAETKGGKTLYPCITSLESFLTDIPAKRTEDSKEIINRVPPLHSSDSFLMSPTTPTESITETLASKHRKDVEGLRKVSWFYADIPRETALEMLSGKPEGSFIVRESSTKPGCFALSLRVPLSKNPSGIAHYLILHTNRGYKIKGFTKEFHSLQTLITHHSIMPEMLPCPLLLPRFNNDRNNFRREDDMDFVDDQQDRCSLFGDIHWLMTDLKL